MMKNIPGILLCSVIALPAWYFGRRVPLAGGPIIAILAGILISLLIPNLTKLQICKGGSFAAGVRFTSRKLLQFSIILLGFEMNLYNIMNVGRMALVLMFFTFLTAFVMAFFAGRILKLPGNTRTLIGVGTAICGGSAIAAVAPVIGAEDEDVARAISTIFMFNIAAVFVFPVLGRFLGMGDADFGIWAGVAINDTSSVVAAAAVWSNAAQNNTALNYATIVKLSRVLLLVPVTLVLALYTAHKMKGRDTGNFSFTKVFPWFVLFFIAAAVINTFLGMGSDISSRLGLIGKFGIVMAMAAIGLNTNLKSLFTSGIKPIVLGGLCWAAVAIVALYVLNLAGLI